MKSVPDRVFHGPFCVAGVGRSNYHPAVNLVQ